MATDKETKPEVKESAPKRKAIQITSSTTTTGRTIITALCNDGTMWWRDAISDYGDWTQVKPL